MESIFEQSSSFLVRIDFIHSTTRVTISRHRQTPDCRPDRARMAKLADAADLKSADLNRSWGFKSPSGHHRINNLEDLFRRRSLTNWCW